MAQNLILVAIVLFLCLMAEKLSGKFGMPALILFMGVGMLFGSDGILRIAFDNYELAQNICLLLYLLVGFWLSWLVAYEWLDERNFDTIREIVRIMGK